MEHTDLRELDRLDFGGWRGDRFRGIRIAHLDDALRLARTFNVSLHLEIKTKGIGPKLLAALAREGMSERVIFGGEWDEIHLLNPRANKERMAYLEPGITREQVDQLRAAGKLLSATSWQTGMKRNCRLCGPLLPQELTLSWWTIRASEQKQWDGR